MDRSGNPVTTLAPLLLAFLSLQSRRGWTLNHRKVAAFLGQAAQSPAAAPSQALRVWVLEVHKGGAAGPSPGPGLRRPGLLPKAAHSFSRNVSVASKPFARSPLHQTPPPPHGSARGRVAVTVGPFENDNKNI